MKAATFMPLPGRPKPNTIQVRFSSLCTKKTPYGTLYFSPLKTVVTLEQQTGVLAF